MLTGITSCLLSFSASVCSSKQLVDWWYAATIRIYSYWLTPSAGWHPWGDYPPSHVVLQPTCCSVKTSISKIYLTRPYREQPQQWFAVTLFRRISFPYHGSGHWIAICHTIAGDFVRWPESTPETREVMPLSYQLMYNQLVIIIISILVPSFWVVISLGTNTITFDYRVCTVSNVYHHIAFTNSNRCNVPVWFIIHDWPLSI